MTTDAGNERGSVETARTLKKAKLIEVSWPAEGGEARATSVNQIDILPETFRGSAG